MNDTTNANLASNSASTGADDRHSLQTYVSDLLALIKHIDIPIDRQLKMDASANYADAIVIIRDIKSVTTAQQAALQGLLTSMGGDGTSAIKTAWSTLLGVGAAALDGIRATKVSKNLRDDYTALSLASISYTMLHATALGLGNDAVAALAQQHLAAITPIIIRISKAIPSVVLQELRDDGETVRVSAAEISAQATHEAWQRN